ncbi:MAG: hypothetical protein ACKOWN_07505 [Microbacteriaceae bacterium]
MSLFDDPSDVSCPVCGTTDPLEIIYGLPSIEMMTASTEGKIALGGCIIDPESPAYMCRNESCNKRFGSL